MGQPNHYLHNLDNGKPLVRGPQHYVKALAASRYARRIQRHRRQGQLLRGNTPLPAVAAAAKRLGRAANMRAQDNMLIRAVAQTLPTRRELARRGEHSTHWLTEGEAICTVCEQPRALGAPHLVTCPKMRQVWSEAQNKILNGIKKERARHKNKSEQEKSMLKTIDIPDLFPEVRGGKRVLLFLDPEHEREINIHGETNPSHPELQPRELPCPSPLAIHRHEKGAEPAADEVMRAYEDLNATNPTRACLGAPPKQLIAPLSLLGASSKTSNEIWAKLFAPHLMRAASECLTIQNSECGSAARNIANCRRCEAGVVTKPRRKKRKLSAGVSAL